MLKRTEFVTLKTSALNCRLCFSLQGINQRLDKPRSIPKYPSPRIWLRPPDWPGKGLVNEFMAAGPLLKTLTAPGVAFLNTPVCTGPVRSAWPPSSQFVGHCAPLETFTGNPLVNRHSPESCQPPIIAFTGFDASAANLRPLPNGKSNTQLALN